MTSAIRLERRINISTMIEFCHIGFLHYVIFFLFHQNPFALNHCGGIHRILQIIIKFAINTLEAIINKIYQIKLNQFTCDWKSMFMNRSISIQFDLITDWIFFKSFSGISLHMGRKPQNCYLIKHNIYFSRKIYF